MHWHAGINVKDITFVDGTCYKTKDLESVYDVYTAYLPMKKSGKTNSPMRRVLRFSTKIRIHFSGKRLVEPYGERVYVVQNPPAKPLTQAGDGRYLRASIHAGPGIRSYDAAGGIPAIAGGTSSVW